MTELKQHVWPLTYVTVLAGVSLWTGAVVLVWFSVHAGSPVDTRLVATTVIQIWKQTK